MGRQYSIWDHLADRLRSYEANIEHFSLAKSYTPIRKIALFSNIFFLSLSGNVFLKSMLVLRVYMFFASSNYPVVSVEIEMNW